MIVSCPACSARIRIDRERLAGKRVKLRCPRCSEIFQAVVPGEEPVAAVVTAPAVAAPLVLVAHSDPVLCDTVGGVLTAAGLRWQACHDGEAALSAMALDPPQVALMDVALPGLFAFEVVEKVRTRPGLDAVKIILLSSVYNKMAYKRRPSSLYGADDYLEKHHIPTDLVPKVLDLLPGTARTVAAAGGAPAVSPSTDAQIGAEAWRKVQEVNSRLQHAEESETGVAADQAEALEKARRLARIIVSDIALYNQDRVEEGIRTGRFLELLADEIREGRKLFAQRIPAELPGRDEILKQAFRQFIESRMHEMRIGPGGREQ